MEHEEEFDLPEPEHVAAVGDGIADTVGGTEGMALTHAQHYLQGVMFANGMVASTQYHGNEGVIDSIKAGLKKAWDYLVEMVKKVFGFLFGSKKKEEKIKEIEKGFKELDESAKIKPTSNEAEAKVQVKSIITATNHMSKLVTMERAEEGHKAAQETLEKLKTMQANLGKETTPAEVKKISEEAIKEYKETANKAIVVCTAKDVEAARETTKRLTQAIEFMKKIDGTGEGDLIFNMSGLIQSTEKFINAVKQWPEVLESFQTLNQAPAYISKTRSIMTAMSHTLMDFQESKKYFDKKLGMFHSKMENSQTTDEEREALKKALKVAGTGITGVSQVAKWVELFLNNTQSFIDHFTLELQKA